MNQKTAIAALAALCITSGSAFAGEYYVAGSLGRSTTSIDKAEFDRQLASLGAGAVTSSNVDENGTGFKMLLGYQYNPNLAAEVSYVDLGKPAKYSATVSGGSATLEWKASGFAVAALGIMPINDSFSAFAKLGVADIKVEASPSATGTLAATGSVSATKAGANFGLGGNYAFNKSLRVRLEWEQFQNVGDKDKTGQGDVNLLSLGLVYKF